ncbi:MAG: putative membrane protein [Algoriphagus marincola HL-49]|uniref:Putative membrane protein n=1 Tax=Algoriphagus marincola HL-49 TaxID=1305737 RepID=A0A0P7Y000_9BACT|nr:MAG: putative membrane protein [Algoriphagus marincola HL-49]
MRSIKKYLLNYLKGMAMGAADIVPGVSGGSIALITGIYQQLLDSINSFNKENLSLLLKLELKGFFKSVNGKFLLSLVLGILTSAFSLSRLITYLMDEHPIPLWSFFCGLILVSAFWILKEIKRWHLGVVLAVILGTALAWWVTELPPTSSPDAIWFTFVAGAIAICAMILPGISGSFILLILGKYENIMTAISERDLFTLGVFAAGCVVGILSFSRVISWLLKKFYSTTIGLLSGFMLGSINKLWPWKVVTQYRTSSSGEQKPFLTENLWPSEYLDQVGLEPNLGLAIAGFVGGIVLVLGIDLVADYLKK